MSSLARTKMGHTCFEYKGRDHWFQDGSVVFPIAYIARKGLAQYPDDQDFRDVCDAMEHGLRAWCPGAIPIDFDECLSKKETANKFVNLLDVLILELEGMGGLVPGTYVDGFVKPLTRGQGHYSDDTLERWLSVILRLRCMVAEADKIGDEANSPEAD